MRIWLVCMAVLMIIRTSIWWWSYSLLGISNRTSTTRYHQKKQSQTSSCKYVLGYDTCIDLILSIVISSQKISSHSEYFNNYLDLPKTWRFWVFCPVGKDENLFRWVPSLPQPIATQQLRIWWKGRCLVNRNLDLLNAVQNLSLRKRYPWNDEREAKRWGPILAEVPSSDSNFRRTEGLPQKNPC